MPLAVAAVPGVTATVADAPVVVEDRPAPSGPSLVERRSRGLWLGAAAAVVVGVALRCWTPAHLWLDEALSVNLARQPLSELPEALRHDGAPPLYYLLLHGWTRLVGTGDVAVRLLSGVVSVATLPLMWLAGRRLGGRVTAWAAFMLLVTSPFAIRYATEARMYSLVMFLTVLGYLAFVRALERPTWWRLSGVALVTTALLLTHYWTIYLLVVVAGLLLFRRRRGGDTRPAGRVLLAMGAGVVLFLPWAPTFLYQFLHTGTPWANRPNVNAIARTLEEFGGGRGEVEAISSLLLLALAGLGLFGRPLDQRRLVLELHTQPAGRSLALLGVGAVALGVLVGLVTGAGFAVRYTAMALPLFVLLASLGVATLVDDKVRRGVLAVVAILGLWTGARSSFYERTTAGTVAEALEEQAAPGDVVAYCPDQLGPAVSRLLPASRFDQVSFPRGHGPDRVDWVDYAEVNRAAQPKPFAEMLLRRGAGKDIWVVWSPGYKTFGAKCEALIAALRTQRPAMTRPVRVKLRYPEHPGLVHFSR